MKRIIMHWTAGRNDVSKIDLRHYHFVVDGKGIVHEGRFPVEANIPPLKPGKYAAHTRRLNSYSIGVSMAGMYGAVERPFNPGPFPLTKEQVKSFVDLVAKLAVEYGIPVSRKTILSHAEVQPTLGVWQRGKWDIAWLPGMDKPGDPISVGDQLRRIVGRKVKRLMREDEGGEG